MNLYNVIGVMSGTSLDGIDLCYCSFELSNDQKWSYKINKADTVKLDDQLKTKLSEAIQYSGLELSLLNNELGNYIGEQINLFLKRNNIHLSSIDFISSHGHTIFHQPQKKLTLQIGNGANISAISKIPVICDFRSIDVAMNGQGAPLVPIGDELLFSEYNYCLNLGGIANISFNESEKRMAFDICPTNIVLNRLSKIKNLEFDDKGKLAKSGTIHQSLFNELNSLSFYSDTFPKSLGIEWIEKNIFPILYKYSIDTKDLLRTFTEHIAFQISRNTNLGSSILITGGGAKNEFLIERISELSKTITIIPSKELIDFKEALVFGFLGVLRYRKEINVLKSVTGSITDNIGGCIYHPILNS